MLQIKKWCSCRWQRNTRYYEAHLQQDLFGWVVILRWGSIDTLLGRQVTEPLATYDDGVDRLLKIGEKRIKRNYALVSQ